MTVTMKRQMKHLLMIPYYVCLAKGHLVSVTTAFILFMGKWCIQPANMNWLAVYKIQYRDREREPKHMP